MTPKAKPLAYPAPVAARFRRDLLRLFDDMAAECERELRALFDTPHAREHLAMDASVGSQARMTTNAIKARFTQLFNAKAKELADNMITGVDKASGVATARSIRELSNGKRLDAKRIPKPLREIYKAATQEAATLIKSIASEYLDRVSGAVSRAIVGNGGMGELIKTVEKAQDMGHRRAELLALDQVRKVYSNANAERLKSFGVTQFEWIHSSAGVHPREQHQEWDGQIFSFDDLPEDDDFGPVLPGDAINCRCTMRPVVEFEGKDDDTSAG